MSLSAWILVILVILFVIALCFAIGWSIRNGNVTPNPAPAPFTPPQVWSTPEPTNDPIKGVCRMYQFPGTYSTAPGIGKTYVPGAPTFAAPVLNGKDGAAGIGNLRCLDFDQIIAQQVQRKCTQPINTATNGPSLCYELNGELVTVGAQEVFYTNNNCPSIPQCAGQLALVAVNYQQPAPTGPTGNYCLEVLDASGAVGARLCDPTKDEQMFRVTRVNIGQDPRSLTSGQGQNGIITQIYQRSSGLCLVPGGVDMEVEYDLARVGGGCSGIGIIDCTSVKMGTCTGGISPGYVWASIPSIAFCDIPSGCQGCTGCHSGTCQRIPYGTSCTGIHCLGQTGCTGFIPMPTPTQLLYVGNTLNEPPYRNGTYQGLTGSNALFQWLRDRATPALFSGGTEDVCLYYQMPTDLQECFDRSFTIQYLDLATYNTMNVTPVCTVIKNTGCIPL